MERLPTALRPGVAVALGDRCPRRREPRAGRRLALFSRRPDRRRAGRVHEAGLAVTTRPKRFPLVFRPRLPSRAWGRAPCENHGTPTPGATRELLRAAF